VKSATQRVLGTSGPAQRLSSQAHRRRKRRQEVTGASRPIRGLNQLVNGLVDGPRTRGAPAFDVDEGGTEVVPSQPTADGLQRRNLGRISSAYNSKKSR
jgi:hypothetical protein